MNGAPRPLATLLDEAVAAHGDDVALRLDDSSWSYRELNRLVDRTASFLAAHGVVEGSRVGLSAGNGVEFVAVMFATFRLGASLVMVSTAWRDREVEHALAISEPTHIVTDGSGAASLVELVTDRPVLPIAAIHDGAAGVAAPARVGLDDLALMVFSSGTTGLPKAVRHSHRTIFHGTMHWVDALGLSSTDRLQITTPPFHILGALNLLAVVAAGASVRLHRRFDLDAMLQAIERDGVTIEMAVAPIALAMASHVDLERFDLSSLRYIMWGATPVTASVAETITRRSGVRVLPAYGASELPVIAVNPVDRPDEWRLDSVGLPPAGVTMRVIDLESGDIAAPGAVGELQARSPSLMVGYLPDHGQPIDDGWYATGDVGSGDAAGWVTITDRVKEMIKVNGFQVAPAEVEGVLLGHPGIVDCAVFGVADDRTGEAVVAAVVVSDDLTASADTVEELRSLVAANLASYKRVAEVTFVEQIPRLPSGKVLRRELKAGYARPSA
ncbi:MAG: class I adenylate-forming enzyme family protein [Ilumatobacteraceae bacterium]